MSKPIWKCDGLIYWPLERETEGLLSEIVGGAV